MRRFNIPFLSHLHNARTRPFIKEERIVLSFATSFPFLNYWHTDTLRIVYRLHSTRAYPRDNDRLVWRVLRIKYAVRYASYACFITYRTSTCSSMLDYYCIGALYIWTLSVLPFFSFFPARSCWIPSINFQHVLIFCAVAREIVC